MNNNSNRDLKSLMITSNKTKIYNSIQIFNNAAKYLHANYTGSEEDDKFYELIDRTYKHMMPLDFIRQGKEIQIVKILCLEEFDIIFLDKDFGFNYKYSSYGPLTGDDLAILIKNGAYGPLNHKAKIVDISDSDERITEADYKFNLDMGESYIDLIETRSKARDLLDSLR